MSTNTAPYRTVAASVVFYTFVLSSLLRSGAFRRESSAADKLISGVHGLSTSIAALAVLNNADWESSLPTSPKSQEVKSSKSTQAKQGKSLDDSANPIIAGKSQTGNALTAWETGYLIYDTGAILYQSYNKTGRKNLSTATSAMVKDSPVFVVHHLVLISALGYLQTYTAKGREKGVWVIVCFLLMNASNPLLHLRWWLRRIRGRASKQVDGLLAASFAGLRFGVVAWIMRKYGAYHGMSGWEAYRSLRAECQVGTGVITGVNAVWWVLLVGQLVRRSGGRVKSS